MRTPNAKTVVFISLALVAGCGEKKPASNATPAPEVTESPEDLGQPGPAVVVRVEATPDGQVKSESAHMRSLANEVDSEDESALEAAWENGAPTTLASSAESSSDELDSSSSTASWHDYRGEADYDQYEPTAYSKHRTRTYKYRPIRKIIRGIYRYHYYRRSDCPCKPYPQPLPPRHGGSIDQDLRTLLDTNRIAPARDADFLQATPARVKLGERLFNDKNLSGPRSVACVTCHNPANGTSDRWSLGPTLKGRESPGRAHAPSDLLARNSPSLYNRGHNGYIGLFADSRVRFDGRGGIETPAGADLPKGLESLLAAQALFPMANPDEMLGDVGTNELAVSTSFPAIWDAIARRIAGDQSYKNQFAEVFPGEPITIVQIANALSAYEAVAFRADDAPFDRYLKGDANAMQEQEKLGAIYFYGKARCATCHTGTFQTDHRHHGIAMPQFGPGAGDGEGGRGDFGFARVTKLAADRYKFRTPSLRNVALSGPWGHTGAYSSLKAFVIHYTNPARGLASWDWNQIILPYGVSDRTLMAAHTSPTMRQDLVRANEASSIALTDAEIDAIVAFLHALTDGRYVRGGHLYR